MTEKQPGTLRLARLIDYHAPTDFDGHLAQAAAELRRLHAENEELRAQIGQGVPDVGQFINLLVSAAFRKGELWERCQGKFWPEAESNEFTKLRDKTIPDAIASLKQAIAFTHPAPQQKALTDEQRRDLQKVRDSLDPEDWCGDERMVDVLDRVLVASCCVNFAAGTSCFADQKSNCPRLAVAHGIGEKK